MLEKHYSRESMTVGPVYEVVRGGEKHKIDDSNIFVLKAGNKLLTTTYQSVGLDLGDVHCQGKDNLILNINFFK